MRRSELANVFNVQGQPGLMGMHGHVLGAVIGVYAPYVAHHSDSCHVADENRQAKRALDGLAYQATADHWLQDPHHSQGQQKEQRDAEYQREPEGETHHPSGNSLAVRLLLAGAGGCQVG